MPANVLTIGLGLRVVAEGVATEQAAGALVAMGCDVAQRYYISRPLPAAEMDRWLSQTWPQARCG